MKKMMCVLLVMAVLATIVLCGCGNQQLIDTTYSYEYGYVALPNGEVIEGKVSSWRDWEDSDTIQVVINGKTYYTHTTNVILVSE